MTEDHGDNTSDIAVTDTSVLNDVDLMSTVQMMTISPNKRMTASNLFAARYDQLLLSFVSDPFVLRRMLKNTKSVVSGSNALKLVSPIRVGDWVANDLDIYTYPQPNADRLISFFKCAGYTLVDRPAPKKFYHRIEPGFVNVVSLTRQGKKIDIIISAKHSALFPISRFWNTFLFNFITSDSLCVAYPEHVLGGHGLIRDIGMAHPRLEMLKEKYAARGYESNEPVLLDLGLVLPRKRRFGDEDCLVLALGPSGVTESEHRRAREKILELGEFFW
ncbi:hypothetical protein NLI96_g12060 [Meripilus lineatus]|uniref:Uncharacterized protein n=1 Tax=Meripilus lineatus TaxID=2056292 RepID=A0AAD5UUQ2_9APHY|nr:hypothetical protein NLI96_g12060 [Physisporinus lineatus]